MFAGVLSRWRTFSRSARSTCCVSVSPQWLSWAELRGEHHLVAAAGQRPPAELLVRVGAVDLGDVDQGHPEVDARWIVRINCSSSSLAPVYYADIAIAPKPMRATSKRPNLTCFIAFLPAYAATNRVRLRDATMVDSADAPASVARQSRYA